VVRIFNILNPPFVACQCSPDPLAQKLTLLSHPLFIIVREERDWRVEYLKEQAVKTEAHQKVGWKINRTGQNALLGMDHRLSIDASDEYLSNQGWLSEHPIRRFPD
jgi:hypothetical protein